MSLNPTVQSELVCPWCKNSLDFRSKSDRMLCHLCDKQFPIVSAMVSFVTDLKEQKQTASTFGFEWKAFAKGSFDNDDIFGLRFDETAHYFLSRVGLRLEDLAGLKILDAGTGSGRIPKSLRAAGCTVYAVDIQESIDLIAEHFKSLDAAHLFRADLFQLPFKDEFFDVAWSSGVIHHTPDAEKAFTSIAKKVKPGGRMFVSVYGKDLHHYRLFRRLMPFARHLPIGITYFLAALVGGPVYLAFNAALALIRLRYRNQKPPYRLLGFTVENNNYQSYRSILLNMFDQLHPKYQSEHSVEEVRKWFHANGMNETVVVEFIGMVGIRGVKNRESRQLRDKTVSD